MQQAMATMMQQGKQGAMTLDQVAGQFARLSAAGQRFGFHGAEGVAQLGGLANIARTATGSSEQASTSVEQMLGHIIQNAIKLKGAGVSVFDKHGQTRNIDDVLVDMVQKVGGKNMALKKIKLQELLGEEGVRAASPLMATYNKVFSETKGTDSEKVAAATAALREQLSQAIHTTETWDGVMSDAAQIQQSNSAQLTATWESLVAEVGKELVPALNRVVPKMLELVPAINPVIALLGGLAEALLGVLKLIGFTAAPTSSAEQAKQLQEKADAAQKKADSYREHLVKQTNAGDLPSAADMSKLQDLDDTAQNLSDRATIMGDKASKATATGTETPEQFAKHFAELSGKGPSDPGYQFNLEAGQNIAKHISQSPNDDFRSKEYTPDQQLLVNQRAEQEKSLPTEEAAKNMAKLNASMDAINAAAIRAARALEKVGDSARTSPNSDR
jgi:hypothetical protein